MLGTSPSGRATTLRGATAPRRRGPTTMNAVTVARSESAPRQAYETDLGAMYESDVETFLGSYLASAVRGDIQMIFTSPPFPLNRKKKYGNRVGDEYLD